MKREKPYKDKEVNSTPSPYSWEGVTQIGEHLKQGSQVVPKAAYHSQVS